MEIKMAKNKKQNGVNNAEMNLDRAREIVASDERGKDFEAALQYLRMYDPENPALKEVKEVEDGVNETVEKALKAMENDKAERGILGDENQDLNNDEDVEKNLNGIISIYAEEGFKTRLNLIVNRDTNHVGVDNDGNILGEGEDKTPEQKDEEKQIRKAVLNEVLEAAKHEVYMFYGRDEKFASYNEEQKRKILEESVTDVFNFKMAKSVAASAVKEATAEEAKPNTEANESYQQKALADMRAALEAFYTKKPVNVKPQQILNTTVNTSVAMDEYEQGLRAANLKKSTNTFNKVKENYNEKRRGFWGKAFDMAKGVWQGIKQNKARIITDAAVVVGAGLAATVAPYVAAGGLALYFATSSFAWLVNDERRNQKAKAENKANWSGLKGFGNAWKSIKSDEKKYRKFKTNGGLTAVAGVAGAGLFGWAATGAMATALGLSTTNAATVTVANTATARVALGAARSLGSVTSQGTNWALASSDYKKDATEENKAALDSAKKGFFISAGAALLSNAVSAAINADSIANGGAENAGAGVEGVTGADGAGNGGADGAGNGGAEGAGNGGAEGAGVEGTTVEHTPVEWQGDITEKQWNALNRDITGIYKDHADIFGKGNIDPKDAMENVYQNIDNARAAGYFQNQSNEEVLFKYIQLIKQTERVEVLKGTNYLVTKLGEDGNPMYWVNAEEMNALNKIIICNEVVDIPADKLDGVLALINEKGKYIGEGADIGVTNNTFAGARVNCEDYQNAWERHAFVNKHPRVDNTPAPETPAPENTPAPEAAKVEETFADKHKAPEGANVDETVNNVQKKAPTEQFTWKEQKWTGKDNTAISGSGDTPVKTVAQGVGKLNSGRE
jgi:hypothetical protein